MGKIRRINPMSYWLIGEHESWFSHMASKGYHLVKINQLFSTFEKREPAHIKYRIELVNGTVLSIEQIDLYEQCGWDYVASSKLFHIFASPAERHATEIYTDATEQAITVEYLKKASKRNLIGFGFSTAIFLVVTLSIILLNEPILYWLVAGGVMFNFLLGFIYGMNTIVMYRGYKNLRNLAVQLEQGQEINHEAEWRSRFLKEWVGSALFLGISLWIVCLPIYSITKMNDLTIPDDTADEPILRIETLLAGQYERQPMEEFMNGADWHHLWQTEWSPLAPVIYETRQDGFAVVDGEATKVQERLDIQYYEMRFEALASPMLASIMEYLQSYRDDQQFNAAEHAVFEELYVYEDAHNVELYAKLGKQLIALEYSGQLSSEAVIEKAAAFYIQFK